MRKAGVLLLLCVALCLGACTADDGWIDLPAERRRGCTDVSVSSRLKKEKADGGQAAEFIEFFE